MVTQAVSVLVLVRRHHATEFLARFLAVFVLPVLRLVTGPQIGIELAQLLCVHVHPVPVTAEALRKLVQCDQVECLKILYPNVLIKTNAC